MTSLVQVSIVWFSTFVHSTPHHNHCCLESSLIGFPRVIADSEWDMPGIKPGPLSWQHTLPLSYTRLGFVTGLQGRSHKISLKLPISMGFRILKGRTNHQDLSANQLMWWNGGFVLKASLEFWLGNGQSLPLVFMCTWARLNYKNIKFCFI